MNKNIVFQSPFKNLLEQYVDHRKISGYNSPSGLEDIIRFDVYAASKQTASNQLTKELVEEYIAHRPGEKPPTQVHRISTVRCFGKYLVRCGIPAYVLPCGVLPVEKYTFIPYVFSIKEIACLMKAVDSLPYRANSPQRHLVIPMMFRMMYGCGLRISEAIKLCSEDVDIQTGVLSVKNTKFNKSRYVPMAQSLLQCCREYTKNAAISDNSRTPFLPSPSRGFYCQSTIGYAFQQCLAIAGIPHNNDGPTVHSLRHSFAVHNLVKWGKANKDINAFLPHLSAYMGHENILGTERYLRITFEMFPEIMKRVNAECSWVMPEVISIEE